MSQRSAQEQAIIARAKAIHDQTCNCDPRYLMSCPNMANAILDGGHTAQAGQDAVGGEGGDQAVCDKCSRTNWDTTQGDGRPTRKR